MQVGMRVDTKYGQGTVKGFERFTTKGSSDALSSDFQWKERIAVELDPGHTWPAPDGMDCYFYLKDIRPALRPVVDVITRGSQALDERDFHRLLDFLPLDQSVELGYSLNDGEDFTPKSWTWDNVVEQLGRDIEFGFQKALDQRGISASLMSQVVGMWLFALQDSKGLQVLQDQYAQYGLPVFKYAALKYGFPNPIGDDVGNEAKYAG